MFDIKNKKIAFTLAEAMMFLLIATIILVAAMPVITRKHVQPLRLPHGKWACMRSGGEYFSISLGDSSAPIPPLDDPAWVRSSDGKCHFPRLPETVKSILVRVIGGGASGGQSSVTYEQTTDTHEMFPDVEGVPRNVIPKNSTGTATPYLFRKNGFYNLKFLGASGEMASLSFPGLIIGYKDGPVIQTCQFNKVQQSALNQSVPVLELNNVLLSRGDRIRIKYGNPPVYTEEYQVTTGTNTADSAYFGLNRKLFGESGFTALSSYHYCNYNVDADLEYNGVNFTYHFEKVDQTPGKGGVVKTIQIRRYANVGTDNANWDTLAVIKGGRGSYYASEDSAGSFCLNPLAAPENCSGRYTPQIPEPFPNVNDAIEVNNATLATITGDSDPEVRMYFLRNDTSAINGSGLPSTYAYREPTLVINGGNGGSAGEVVTGFMIPPKKDITIEIGEGGAATDSLTSGGEQICNPGGDTRFGDLVAEGGSGCGRADFPMDVPEGTGSPGAIPDYSMTDEIQPGAGGLGGVINTRSAYSGNPVFGTYAELGIGTYASAPADSCMTCAPNNKPRPAAASGGNALGIGSGGGGAGVVLFFQPKTGTIATINRTTPKIVDLNNNNNRNNGDDAIYYYSGRPGNGANGGIIVTW